MTMSEYRLLKLGEQLRQEISALILRGEIKDPRVSEFMSVNRVEVTRDLKFAKVYVSSFLDDGSIRRGVAGLQSAAGFIQSSIARKLTIRQFPKFSFIADFSIKDGLSMVQRLGRLAEEEAAVAERRRELGIPAPSDFADVAE